VHLCDYPVPNEDLIDAELSAQMDLVTAAVSAVLGLRTERRIRVRQPLPELTVITPEPAKAAALRRFEAQILDELNVKKLTIRESAADIERYEIIPRMALLGPKHKSLAGKVAHALKALDPVKVARAVEAGDDVALSVDGVEVRVAPGEIEVRHEMPDHLASAQAGGVTLILDTTLTPALEAEGWARDVVRHVQQHRKECGLNIEDRIRLRLGTASADLAAAVERWRDTILAETLSVSLEVAPLAESGDETVRIGDAELAIRIEKAQRPPRKR